MVGNKFSIKILAFGKKARPPARRGFTLIETLVSLAVFTILVSVISATAVAIVRQAHNFRENTTVAALADQYMEVARNLPYSQVGTVNGNPYGTLPDLPNALNVSIGGVNYQIYYVVNYVDDPADGTFVGGTDPAPNDYKQLKLYIKNTATNVTTNFLTNIAPKGLEGMNNGGALAIKVFDAVGQPVPNAAITITNNLISPHLNVTRTSDASGNWVEVGLPGSANSYHIIVTKNGYSTDQTYAVSGGNPNPIKADATILAGQITQVSFSIDKLSTLVFNTLNQTCGPLPNIGLEERGAKLIGTPDVLKFDNSYTSNSAGQISLSNLEWDNYTPAITTNGYMIYGSSPIQQISVLPNTSQTYTLILGPKTDNSLLVIVKDAATGNLIEGALVTLQSTSSADMVKTTSGSIWNQQEWSGGSGQQNFSNPSRYATDDGNVSSSGIPSGLRLASYGGVSYATSGTLTSSTFDTGTSASTYTSLTWQPTSQDPSTQVSFQIATSSDNATWHYVGPNGAADTYFTVPGSAISASNNGGRYVRYKVFLSTTDTSKTPVLTSVGINYVSGCFTPGQAMFPGLDEHANYQITVSMNGFQTQTIGPLTAKSYQTLQVLLNQ